MSSTLEDFQVGDYVDLGFRAARGYYGNPAFRAKVIALRPADNQPIGMHQIRYWDELEVEWDIPTVERARVHIADVEGGPHLKECDGRFGCTCFKERVHG